MSRKRTTHRSHPRWGKRYRPAPPPSSNDLRHNDGKRRPLYARRSTALAIPHPEPPAVLLDQCYSFDLYFDWCYGVAIVDDPRDFFPDPTCCTRAQIVEWQSAVIAVERGLIPMVPRDYPVFTQPWGTGISLIRKDIDHAVETRSRIQGGDRSLRREGQDS